MFVQAPDGDGGAGFTVPQGDPGQLRSAASQWGDLLTALEHAKHSVTAAAEGALDTGGWTGSAASAFSGHSFVVLAAITGGMEAAASARGALDALAEELTHVQSVTRAALADYNSASSTYVTQSAKAAEADADATRTETQAAGTAHPAARAELNRQAATSRSDETTASHAAGTASNDMSAASTRGTQAVTAYDSAVAQIEIRLRQAASALITIPDGGSWMELVLKSVDAALTFSGGLTFIGKSYEAQLASGVKALDKEFDAWWDSPATIKALDAGKVPPEPTSDDPDQYDRIKGSKAAADALDDSAWGKFLTKAWTDDDGLVSKVPIVAQALTLFEILNGLHDHENPVKAIGEPVVNLAAGTAVAEVTSSGLSTLLASDAAVAVLGTAEIPGVGEVVIVGAVTVAAVYALDKVATYVWDHPNQVAHDITSHGGTIVATDPAAAPVVATAWAWEHKDQIAHDVTHPVSTIEHGAEHAWHDVTHPVSTVEHLASDLNPF